MEEAQGRVQQADRRRDEAAQAEVGAGRLDDEQRRELTAAFAAKAYRECREVHLLAPHLERRRAEQQRGDELAVSSVYVQPPAELLVEAIAVYRAAYALAKQERRKIAAERRRRRVGVVEVALVQLRVDFLRLVQQRLASDDRPRLPAVSRRQVLFASRADT